jgi:hypothetical protein
MAADWTWEITFHVRDGISEGLLDIKATSGMVYFPEVSMASASPRLTLIIVVTDC